MISLSKVYQKLKTNDFEENSLIKIIHARLQNGQKILDVGCGYGRYLKILSKDYKVIGVETNTHIRKTLIKDKYNVFDPKTFLSKNKESFDLILMSHIIEHFSSDDLIKILDQYLKVLKPNGLLIIATPTMNKYFWEDATHVRPYDAASILQLTQSGAQVKYSTKQDLELKELHFYRSPLLFKYEGLMFKANNNKFMQIINSAFNIASKIIFKLSGSVIGTRQSWVGVFQKK